MPIDPSRRVFITGGASGFGLSIAHALAEEGCRVAISDINERQLQSAAEQTDFAAIPLDVTDAGAVSAAVQRAEQELGGLDTVVISAGVIHVKPLEEVTEADWDATLSVNLKGAFLVAQAAAPALRASGRGRIVAIASDAARRGYPWIQAYCASKFGLMGLCESLAVELASEKVTVNCVCPGACPTTGMGQGLTKWKMELTEKSEEEILESIAQSHPLGRYATEDDITRAVLYFLSEDASFLTGVALDVDGGEHLGFLPAAS